MIITLAGAVIGAAYGLHAAGKRSGEAYTGFQRAKWIAEKQKKLRDRGKQSAISSLELGAASETANSRENAVQAFAAKSAGESALGVSGVSSGTPFYKLGQDVRDNLTRLNEAEAAARARIEGMALQAEGAMAGSVLEDAQAMWALADMESELGYASSPVASLLGGVTGAFSGASAGANMESFALQSGLIDPLKGATIGKSTSAASGALGGAVMGAAKPNSMFSQKSKFKVPWDMNGGLVQEENPFPYPFSDEPSLGGSMFGGLDYKKKGKGIVNPAFPSLSY